jgi:hypothetical protein
MKDVWDYELRPKKRGEELMGPGPDSYKVPVMIEHSCWWLSSALGHAYSKAGRMSEARHEFENTVEILDKYSDILRSETPNFSRLLLSARADLASILNIGK